VVDVVEITWSRRRFAANLTRFYGEKLPPGSRKQWHCGSGPFLVVVVEDDRPNYVTPELGRSPVNRRMLEARARYRELTGGGHRVHATLDTHEFAHDVFLLLGANPERYADRREWDGDVRHVRSDTTGSRGWSDLDQLYEALTVTLSWVIVAGGSDIVPVGIPPSENGADVELLVEDAWWGDTTIVGRRRRGSRTRDVPVGGRSLSIVVWAVGDGPDAPREREILERRVRVGRAFVPAGDDVTLVAGLRNKPGTPQG
jgi:hypothetical protein